MTPLKITCALRNGFAANDPWSPSIDGILGYFLRREQLGEERFAVTSIDSSSMTPVDDLPLAKIEWNGDWWYRCSSPVYASQAEFLRYYHRRFDAAAAVVYLQPQRAKLETRCGPFKNYRLSARVIVTPEVVWYAVGDQAEVERLLRRCSAIGGKIGAGFGRVKAWRVEKADSAAMTMQRPVPAGYAREHGIDGIEMAWSYRPPGRIAINQGICVMPATQLC